MPRCGAAPIRGHAQDPQLLLSTLTALLEHPHAGFAGGQKLLSSSGSLGVVCKGIKCTG